jgi:hypothetical protein
MEEWILRLFQNKIWRRTFGFKTGSKRRDFMGRLYRT